nr:acetyl/propionyl/methylcrotonyl-CoA carboxylase subunit alpha [Allosaccharopolyspora coralli]
MLSQQIPENVDTVLVANRGEIAVRVMRTLRRMGIRSVAVYSDADAGARHVAEADIAVHIGPRSAAESYLSIEKILGAARATGAQAIHPGYGFLAENAAFASACADAGVTFIGPPASAIDSMGDKIRAKNTVGAAGVPVVPGRSDTGMSDADVRQGAVDAGFPVLLKPSAGGGGKGMRAVYDESTLDDQIAAARREAKSAFGDDTLLVERYVATPRHIEVQVLADAHGNVVHLGERECSLQRRHQKIIEEAPSPLLDEDTRHRIGASAVDAARSCGYVGAGTVEFIVSADRPDEFFFMEMNTRLQVEHPVTELVTAVDGTRGLDLVEWQVRVAAGERVPFTQDDLRIDGHAVEARVYAEDPARGFLPTGGEVLALHEPSGDGVRVDSGVHTGLNVGSDYDPMLSKVISWGPTRAHALRRLDAALADTVVLGLGTNISFLRALVGHEDVRAGALDTGLVERALPTLVGDAGHTPDEVYVAAALERLLDAESGAEASPWSATTGWRIGRPAWSTWKFAADGGEVAVRLRGRAADAEVEVVHADGNATGRVSAGFDGRFLVVTFDGVTRRYRTLHADGTTWLAAGGRTWALEEHQLLAEAGAAHGPGDGIVTSPMPGTVLVADAAVGDTVAAGQTLFVVEAMKMEHTITAPVDGSVSEVHVRKGQSVGLDQPLAVLTSDTHQES